MILSRECVHTACKQTRTKAIAQLHPFRDRSRPVRLFNPHPLGFLSIRNLDYYIIHSVRPSFVETLLAEIGTPSPQGTFSSRPSSAPIAYSALVC